MKNFFPKWTLVLLLLPIIAVLSVITDSHGWGGDFALYIHQAKALWQGNIHELAALNNFGLEHSSDSYYSPELYPWGWPLLLAPLVAVAGLNYWILKLLIVVIFAGIVISLFLLFSKKAGPVCGLAVAVFIGLNPAYLGFANNLLATFPFLLFVLVSFIQYEKLNEASLIGWRKIIFTAFLFFFASIIRNEGFLLVFAIALSELIKWALQNFQREKLIERTWHLKVAGFYILFHLIYALLLPGGSSSYIKFSNLVSKETIYGNLYFYFDHLDYFFGSFLTNSFTSVTLLFVMIGLFKQRYKDMAIVIYFLLLLTTIIVFPIHEVRFLYNIVPFCFYFLFHGLQSIDFTLKLFRQKLSSSQLMISGIVLLLFVDLFFFINKNTMQANVTDGPAMEEAKQIFDFVNTKTKKDDVIVFFKPRVMSLYTKHRSCMIYDSLESLRKTGNYVILHKQKGDYNQISSIINHPPDWLYQEMENKYFIIYKIN